MSLELLIDGYNLIRQSPALSQIESVDLENGRDALLERLSAYRQVRGHRITVVFDGWGNFHHDHQEMNKRGITVVFTRRGETADEWIRRRLGTMRRGVMVTSDREVQGYAEQVGIPFISSQEFEHKMDETFYRDLKGIEYREEHLTSSPKKGLARRLPRKEKRRHAVWEKL